MFFLFLLPNLSRVAGVAQPARKTYDLLRDWQYWVSTAVISLLVAAAVESLVWWVPGLHSLVAETASMVVRFSLALVLVVFAWMLLGALCARLYEPSSVPHGEPAVSSTTLKPE